jgi:hypothetical protein
MITSKNGREEPLLNVWDLASNKTSLFKRLYDAFFNRIRVLIIGSGGVGKTILTKYLKDGFLLKHNNDDQIKYQITTNIEHNALSSKFAGYAIDTPGDDWYSSKNDLLIDNFVNKWLNHGVIHVVAGGYSSFTNYSFKETKYFKQGDTESDFLKTYREAQIANDIQILKRIKPIIKSAKRNMWFITLISKEDLWWDQRDEIYNIYKNGAYGELINELQSLKNIKFSHRFCSVALHHESFVSGEHETLAKNSSTYNTEIREKNLLNFINSLEDFTR